MKKLNDTIRLKRWQAYSMIALSGFAIGNLLAKATSGAASFNGMAL